MELDPRPSPPSRASSRMSRSTSLSLDLSNLPPLDPPTPPPKPTNSLIFTQISSLEDAFRPEALAVLKQWISERSKIHAFAPIKSFSRIIVSFYDEQSAERVRKAWENPRVDRPSFPACCVFYGGSVAIAPPSAPKDLLQLPDAGKLFFISPPPSPPHDWESTVEGAPNTMVHADDLAEALDKLRKLNAVNHAADPVLTPVSPVDSKSGQRSRSSTLIFQPQPELGNSPDLPCVTVDDMTDEPMEMSPLAFDAPKPILAHTSRPPVELMHDA